MSDWGFSPNDGNGNVGTLTTASSRGIAFSGSAGSMSAWNQIVDAASALPSAVGFHLMAGDNAASAWSRMLDVGIGGAGSEKVILTNWGFCSAGAAQHTYIPIAIPAATRVAIRVAAGNAGSNDFCIHLLHSGFQGAYGLTGSDGIGSSVASNGGTSVTPGTNSKGSYVQLSAATSRAYKGFFICTDPRSSVRASYERALFDIAVGAAASEVVILHDYAIHGGGNDTGFIGSSAFFPIPIPIGVRVAARAASSSGSALGVWLVGVY